jgi:hypothetical protein
MHPLSIAFPTSSRSSTTALSRRYASKSAPTSTGHTGREAEEEDEDEEEDEEDEAPAPAPAPAPSPDDGDAATPTPLLRAADDEGAAPDAVKVKEPRAFGRPAAPPLPAPAPAPDPRAREVPPSPSDSLSSAMAGTASVPDAVRL